MFPQLYLVVRLHLRHRSQRRCATVVTSGRPPTLRDMSVTLMRWDGARHETAQAKHLSTVTLRQRIDNSGTSRTHLSQYITPGHETEI